MNGIENRQTTIPENNQIVFIKMFIHHWFLKVLRVK